MRVLIVEDETAAYQNLAVQLQQELPEATIVANTESVAQTVRWLTANEAPDLIFMDIRLSDGVAFEIFSQVKVTSPIIFTTAYDEYALEAFRQNSLDYLLKPVATDDLRRALDKYRRWSHADLVEYISRLTRIAPPVRYKDTILVAHRDQLIPLSLSRVAYFYTTNKSTSVCLTDGTTYPYSNSLEQIAAELNPNHFTRANRQYVVARGSVESITVWHDGRLLVELGVPMPERLYISKNNTSAFKRWLVANEK